ncbi:MAG: hypothetical protein HY730_00025 [Candidatus Tectomicrobia bacterium]|uniref:Uncharacterized protein n=1 Tax=Tectimicrobiota bacterium TaxID=2528274 RepID=A0A933GJK4_UNCTE|nr:hypothetical protein [Candidatus Tectomicrobia bacterium]
MDIFVNTEFNDRLAKAFDIMTDRLQPGGLRKYSAFWGTEGRAFDREESADLAIVADIR